MLDEMINRRSIRKYHSDKPVTEEDIMEILESGRISPSGSNTQPWHFIVIKSDEMRQKIADTSHNQQWMMSAPVFIACIADARSRISPEMPLHLTEESPESEVKQIIRDTAIATEHLVLSAEHLGLGSCWVAWFTQEEIRPVMNIPDDKYVVGILTIGYADEAPQPRPRKTMAEILHYERW